LLFDEPLAVLVPRRHRLAEESRIALSDLASEKLLVSDDGCAYRALVESALEAGHLDVALGANFGSISTLPYGVAAGLGVAIIPAATMHRRLAGTCLVPLDKPRLTLPVGTLVRCEPLPSHAAQCVLDAFSESLLSRTRKRAKRSSFQIPLKHEGDVTTD